MLFIVPLRVRLPGMVGSLITVLVWWPFLAFAAWVLITAWQVLGWIGLTFAASPLLGRLIDALQRKFEGS
jgi:hypothetical protein